MTPTLQADPLPLRVDDTGSIRVGATRVLLEVVIAEYQKGATAEQIQAAFATLDLADVHAVLAYYLRHRADVEAYLRQRDEAAATVRRAIEADMPARLTRDELLARRAARQESP